MGKHTGKFEDLFEETVTSDDVDKTFENEESKYWIHRTKGPTLYFNPNYKKNNSNI